MYASTSGSGRRASSRAGLSRRRPVTAARCTSTSTGPSRPGPWGEATGSRSPPPAASGGAAPPLAEVRPPPRGVSPPLISLVPCAAFLPALQAGFVNWDDPENLLKNEAYRGLGWAQLRWMFTAFHMGHYHPLTWITLGADYTIWGLNPFGFHLTSLLLHGAAAVAFSRGARGLVAAGVAAPPDHPVLRVGAAAAALLFAVHPLRVESVVWLSERRGGRGGVFFLPTVLADLRAAAA